MLVAAGAEGGLEYGTGVAVVCDYDVLFPTARLDGEASTIIVLQLADGLVNDMEFRCRSIIVVDGDAFVCPIFWRTLCTDRGFGRFGLCGSDALLSLRHVDFDVLSRLWEVLGCVGVG